jgi:tRNA A22 N-methylase
MKTGKLNYMIEIEREREIDSNLSKSKSSCVVGSLLAKTSPMIFRRTYERKIVYLYQYLFHFDSIATSQKVS